MREFAQDIYESIDTLISDKINEGVHTSASGKVGKVENNFSADIKPDLEVTTDDGDKVPYPNLAGVRIIMPCGAGGTVGFVFPVKSGDGCVSLFGEGGTGSDLKFDLSNALLIPGLCESAGEETKKAGKEDAAIMFAPTATIVVKQDSIELKKQDTLVTMKDASISVERGASKITVTDGAIESQNGGTTVTKSSGSVSVTAPVVDVTAGVKIKGNVQVQGNVDISGTLTVGGIVMNTHKHSGVHGMTGGPQ